MISSPPVPLPPSRRRVGLIHFAALALAAIVYIPLGQYLWRFISYPIELEWREGTYWLHALAQSYGINIFEDDKVAYVMAVHGIFDHLAKAALIVLFRSWEPQYILRFFVLLFPFISLLAIYLQNRRCLSARPAFLSALCLNAAMQVALHDIGHWNTCVGRSDPTAFSLLAIACLYPAADRASALARVRRHISFLAIALVFSTNWKWYPLALLIPLILEQRHDVLPFRELLRAYLLIGGYTVATCALFVVVWFRGDVSFYFQYFFGLFFGRSPYAGASAPIQTVIHFVRTPAIGVLLVLSVMPVLLEGWRHFVRHTGKWPRTLAALAVLVSMVVLVLALKMNFLSGGYWYLCPQAILLAAYYVSRYEIGPGLAAVILLFGLAVLWRSDNLPLMRWYYVQLGETLPAARQYAETVVRLDRGFGVYSEEAHLFKRSQERGLPAVDMGDGSENLANVNFYGPRFTAIFEAQRTRALAHEPVLLFVGGCPSSAFKALAANEEYCLLLASPAPAIGGGVYVRKDRLGEVQHYLRDPAAPTP